MTMTLTDKPKRLKPDDVYRDSVHPVLVGLGLVPRGQLVHAEGTSQDLRAGIDWLVSSPDGTQTSLAVRVQWDTERGTFSVRYRTEKGMRSELTKRYKSVASGGQYPTLTIQAYVEQYTGRLLNAYVVRTDDLYRHIITTIRDDDTFTLCGCCTRPKWAPGGAEFIAVAVTEEARTQQATRGTLIGHGVPVRMTHPADTGAGLWGAA